MFTVLKVSLEAETARWPLPRPQAWKEERNPFLIFGIFFGKEFPHMIHLLLNDGSIKRRERGQKYNQNERICSGQRKPNSDQEAPQVKRISGKSIRPSHRQFIVLAQVASSPGTKQEPQKCDSPPNQKAPPGGTGKEKIKSGEQKTHRNPDPGE